VPTGSGHATAGTASVRSVEGGGDGAVAAALTDDGIVVASGEIDSFSAPVLEEVLAEAVAGATGDVVVDLGGVTFMDSGGLNVLVRSYKVLDAQDRGLVVRNAPALVRRALEVGGIAEFVRVE